MTKGKIFQASRKEIDYQDSVSETESEVNDSQFSDERDEDDYESSIDQD